MQRLALFFALSVMSMAAVAQNAAPDTAVDPAIAPASTTTTTAQPAPRDEVANKGDVSDRGCLKETGSRLPPRPDSKGRKCINATGRAYTRDDLDSTGAIDLKDALRRLDPAVR